MKNKKKVVVLFLAVVTMLMVVGNVAFASEVVYYEDCEPKTGGKEYCCKKKAVETPSGGRYVETLGCYYK
ncbi:hypothetical protein [Dethiothermospora halolimnae]|uniref:hypothetical protein n=1 Tax=Dethiothermospora halolimnae TaxID=3114390 RepID=UPI003CCC3F22